MKKQCRAPGCSGATSGYSTLCDNHRQAQRRHGNPLQTAVKVQELRPFEAAVEARKTKNPNSEAWGILAARWGVVVEHARATLTRHSDGQVSNRIGVRAAHHIVTVAENAEAWIVVRAVLAMYLLEDHHPRRFISDIAFDFQLVRRVMRLAPVNAGSYWDPKENRSKRVYRDVPPRVVQAIAQPLKEALGGAGLMLTAKQREQAQRAVEERQRLAAALKGLE
jgi:hypothetical protein